MSDIVKKILNEGIDFVGDTLIDHFVPDGYVHNAMKVGLDRVTDKVFDPEANKEVPLVDHSEVQKVADFLVPVLVAFMKNGILARVDIAFVEGANEDMFKQGLLLEFEAMVRQAIAEFIVKH